MLFSLHFRDLNDFPFSELYLDNFHTFLNQYCIEISNLDLFLTLFIDSPILNNGYSINNQKTFNSHFIANKIRYE